MIKINCSGCGRPVFEMTLLGSRDGPSTPEENYKSTKAIAEALKHLLSKVKEDPQYQFLSLDLKEDVEKALHDLEYIDL